MPQTADLFDAPPIARRSDPITSKIAAGDYSRTNRGNDCQVMLNLIRDFPGRTAGEYGDILLARGYKPMKAIRMPTKRISDLRDQLIVGQKRRCNISGRKAQTYFVKAGAQ